MNQSPGLWPDAVALAAAGGFGFWTANFAISLTPLAAEYRSALSVAYVPMLVEALVGGLVIGLCVGVVLIRFVDRIPTRRPVSKALLLSLVALIAVTLVVELPAKVLAAPHDALRLFGIAALFNSVRILALGLAVGALYARLDRHVTRPKT